MKKEEAEKLVNKYAMALDDYLNPEYDVDAEEVNALFEKIVSELTTPPSAESGDVEKMVDSLIKTVQEETNSWFVDNPDSGKHEKWIDLVGEHKAKLLSHIAALTEQKREEEDSWTAWLVEDGGMLPKYRTIGENGIPEWTSDPYKALHFCRREDADRFSQEDEDAWRIVNHLFYGKKGN